MNKVTQFLICMFAVSILASSVTYSMEGDGKGKGAMICGGCIVVSKLIVIAASSSLFPVFSAAGFTGYLVYQCYKMRQLSRSIKKIEEVVEVNSTKLTSIADDVKVVKNEVNEVKGVVGRIEIGQTKQANTLDGHGKSLNAVSSKITGLEHKLCKHEQLVVNKFDDINKTLKTNAKEQQSKMNELQDQSNERCAEIKSDLENRFTVIGKEAVVIKAMLKTTETNTNKMNIRLENISEKQFPKLAADMNEQYNELKDQIKNMQQLNIEKNDLLEQKVEQVGKDLKNGQADLSNKVDLILCNQGGIKYLSNYDSRYVNTNKLFLTQNYNAIKDGSKKNKKLNGSW